MTNKMKTDKELQYFYCLKCMNELCWTIKVKISEGDVSNNRAFENAQEGSHGFLS